MVTSQVSYPKAEVLVDSNWLQNSIIQHANMFCQATGVIKPGTIPGFLFAL